MSCSRIHTLCHIQILRYWSLLYFHLLILFLLLYCIGVESAWSLSPDSNRLVPSRPLLLRTLGLSSQFETITAKALITPTSSTSSSSILSSASSSAGHSSRLKPRSRTRTGRVKQNDNGSATTTTAANTSTIEVVNEPPTHRDIALIALNVRFGGQTVKNKSNHYYKKKSKKTKHQPYPTIATITPTETEVGSPPPLMEILDFILSSSSSSSKFSSSTSTPTKSLTLANTFWLDDRDRAFCKLLLMTVERRLGQIDAVINYCSHHHSSSRSRQSNDQSHDRNPNKKSAVLLQNVLRLGVVQLLFCNVPAYAAIHETVQLLRRRRFHRFHYDPRLSHYNSKMMIVSEAQIRFANAVLRRISRYSSAILLLKQAGADNPCEVNVAPWLHAQWIQQWGRDAVHRIVDAAMSESPRCLTVRQKYQAQFQDPYPNQHEHEPSEHCLRTFFTTIRDGDKDAVLANVAATATTNHTSVKGVVQRLPQGSLRVLTPPPGPISSWPLYDQGVYWLQDVSATLPAFALRSLILRDQQALSISSSSSPTLSSEPQLQNQQQQQLQQQQHLKQQQSLTVVDMCAAPGGKTAQLCDFGLFDSVIAVDVSSSRCQRLLENRNRLQFNYEVVVADGRTWKPPPILSPSTFSSSSTNTATATATATTTTTTTTYTTTSFSQHKHNPMSDDHNNVIQRRSVQAVLLDVPCTASGTASKRPDVLRRSSNIIALLETQHQLACNAFENILGLGGILVYATCSLLPQESEHQVLKLLDKYGTASIEIVPIEKGELPGFDSAINAQYGWLRVLPGDPELQAERVGPCDGFFVARLRKTCSFL